MCITHAKHISASSQINQRRLIDVAFLFALFSLNAIKSSTNELCMRRYNRYNEFALKCGIHPKNLMVLLHETSERTNDSVIAEFRLPSEMSFSGEDGIVCIPSNIDKEGEQLRLEFNNFLCNIIANMTTDGS